MKRIDGFTLEMAEKNLVWVAKMGGYRVSGTYDEIKSYAESDDCRDFDICAVQPTRELQIFVDNWMKKPFCTLPKYFDLYGE